MTTTTVQALTFAAQALAGLPGLPEPYVVVSRQHISIQFSTSCADDHTRQVAVDMLAAVLHLEEPRQQRIDYGATGTVGQWTVDVYAPGLVREEVSA